MRNKEKQIYEAEAKRQKRIEDLAESVYPHDIGGKVSFNDGYYIGFKNAYNLLQSQQPQVEKSFELKHCKHCMQMTNHIGDECQKCKPIEPVKEVAQIISGLKNVMLELLKYTRRSDVMELAIEIGNGLAIVSTKIEDLLQSQSRNDFGLSLSGDSQGTGQSEWISIEDRLPDVKRYNKVLVWRQLNKGQKEQNPSIYPASLCKHLAKDTLWQPIPIPPEK